MEIYAVRIGDICLEELYSICSTFTSEKRYILEKYNNTSDRIRSLLGELLIRTVTINKLRIDNKNLIFDKNQFGKPFLNGYPKHHFNISHSGDFVVCAISNSLIGIDIEKIEQIDYEAIAKDFFTHPEYLYITQEDKNNLRKFYNIWTLKESFIKCCGMGLSMPLDMFSINIDSYNNIRMVSATGEVKSKYYFRLFDIDREYKLAVCSLKKSISNEVTLIDQESLITNYYKLISNGGLA